MTAGGDGPSVALAWIQVRRGLTLYGEGEARMKRRAETISSDHQFKPNQINSIDGACGRGGISRVPAVGASEEF